MKLKYYLRGLGIGIVLSTLILSFSINKESKVDLTEEEIISRAEALGMEMKSPGVKVDYDAINQSITEPNKEKEEEPDDKESNQNIEDDVQESSNLSDSSSEKNGEVVSNEENETSESTQNDVSNQSDEKTNSDNEELNQAKEENSESDSNVSEEGIIIEEPITKVITVRPGMTAQEVSQILEDQGIISSAKAFNLYLIEYKMTEKILSQKLEIAVNTSFEDIAKMLTSY